MLVYRESDWEQVEDDMVISEEDLPSLPDQPCFCDQPTCTKSWICQQLGELRIAHEVITRFMGPPWNCTDFQEMLGDIESECEILVK